MNRFFLVTVALLLFGTSYAQNHFDEDHNGFAKGDRFVSGMVGFNSVAHSNDSKEKNFNVSPRFGYFLNDFVAVGGQLGYAWNQQKEASGQKVLNNSTITAAAFGRYYLLPGSLFSVFGELGLGFGSTRNIDRNWTNGINAGISPGLTYFVGHNFAFEATFGVLSYNTVNPGSGSGTTDSFRVGLDLENINFGLIYKF